MLLIWAINSEYRHCTRHNKSPGNEMALEWKYFGVIDNSTVFFDSKILYQDGYEVMSYKDAWSYLMGLIKEREQAPPLYEFNVGDTVKIYEGAEDVEYSDKAKQYFGELGIVRAAFTNVHGKHVYAVEFAGGGSITLMEYCLQEHTVHVIEKVRAQSYYIQCPECSAIYDYNEDPRGKAVDCTACDSQLEVPFDASIGWGECNAI